MERNGRNFDEYLQTYRDTLSDTEKSIFEAKSVQFALASEVIERRKAAGLTQRELAKAAGISQPELSR